MTSLLRQLCGELEDMCVWKDTVAIMAVREKLEPAVEESEADAREVRAQLTQRSSELETAWRDLADIRAAATRWSERVADVGMDHLSAEIKNTIADKESA